MRFRQPELLHRFLLGLAFLVAILAGGRVTEAAERPLGAALSQAEYRTTSAAIAHANLNGQIDDLARFGAKGAPDRIELLIVRGQYFGRIADYEQAAALAALWHRFDAALHDLGESERRGGLASAIEGARASVLQAMGRFDEALAIRRRHAERTPDVLTLGALASVLADRGETAEATRLFRAAESAFSDVAPFPLAWLAELQGKMWMRAGDLDRARQFYAAAHARLPEYPAVVAQLAWLEAAAGHGTRAVALLRDAAASDDPLVAGMLAYVLPLAGEKDEAARWRTQARARYDELLATHPEAFAHHAAEFFLAADPEPQRALTLAEREFVSRRTPAACALVQRAAEAAGDHAKACAAAAVYLTLAAPTPSVSPLGERAIAERTVARCGSRVVAGSPSPAHTGTVSTPARRRRP